MENEKCVICGKQIDKKTSGSNPWVYDISCIECGDYRINDFTLNCDPPNLSKKQKANISGYLRENQKTYLDENKLENLMNLPTPSFHEKADKLLLAIESFTDFAGAYVDKYNKLHNSLAWCQNPQELLEIIGFLKNERRIKELVKSNDVSVLKIEPEGWRHLEELKKSRIDSKQCFVAMWFSDEEGKMEEIYNKAIEPGIKKAGYDPLRIDYKDHTSKICDEIITEIRRSKFVLADFTGHRGGVYYEAGFAKGLNLEVIWTCRDDDIDNLHFDIQQYNCIKWNEDAPDDFRKAITNRIGAVIGFREKI